MPPKIFKIIKTKNELNINDSIVEVYAYMDFNTSSIELYYNDEKKIHINILKLVQRHISKHQGKIPIKKIFNYISDVKVQYDSKNNTEINIDVELRG